MDLPYFRRLLFQFIMPVLTKGRWKSSLLGTHLTWCNGFDRVAKAFMPLYYGPVCGSTQHRLITAQRYTLQAFSGVASFENCRCECMTYYELNIESPQTFLPTHAPKFSARCITLVFGSLSPSVPPSNRKKSQWRTIKEVIPVLLAAADMHQSSLLIVHLF